MHTRQGSRRIDHIAIGIVAVMLGGLFLFFERLMAGSWRELGALFLAVAVVIAGAAAIDRVRRRRGGSPTAIASPWTIIALTLLGAAAGAAYALVAAGHPVGPAAVSGALVVGALSLLGGARRARAARKSLSPGRPAA